MKPTMVSLVLKYHWFCLFWQKIDGNHSRCFPGCSIIEGPLHFLSLSWINKIFLRYWDISLITITHCANTQWAICYTTIQPPTKVSHKNAHHLWWIKSRIVKVKRVARKEKLTNFEFNNFIVYYKNGPLLGKFYSRLIRDGP